MKDTAPSFGADEVACLAWPLVLPNMVQRELIPFGPKDGVGTVVGGRPHRSPRGVGNCHRGATKGRGRPLTTVPFNVWGLTGPYGVAPLPQFPLIGGALWIFMGPYGPDMAL